jgi:hypothetical protein
MFYIYIYITTFYIYIYITTFYIYIITFYIYLFISTASTLLYFEVIYIVQNKLFTVYTSLSGLATFGTNIIYLN